MSRTARLLVGCQSSRDSLPRSGSQLSTTRTQLASLTSPHLLPAPIPDRSSFARSPLRTSCLVGWLTRWLTSHHRMTVLRSSACPPVSHSCTVHIPPPHFLGSSFCRPARPLTSLACTGALPYRSAVSQLCSSESPPDAPRLLH